jgi:hypothetical protein
LAGVAVSVDAADVVAAHRQIPRTMPSAVSVDVAVVPADLVARAADQAAVCL